MNESINQSATSQEKTYHYASPKTSYFHVLTDDSLRINIMDRISNELLQEILNFAMLSKLPFCVDNFLDASKRAGSNKKPNDQRSVEILVADLRISTIVVLTLKDLLENVHLLLPKKEHPCANLTTF